ncbi:hypothetical protein AB0O57_29600 [Streptomyces sp. NPDC091201]|uniref:hypothetical protein n=1 Tax=Streptomyces sp. NPDC091201 TaxID=3155190 RepID=UPI0034356024
MTSSTPTAPISVPAVVQVPLIPGDADVYRSWRQVLTGVDETGLETRVLLGPEVGHGATVEVPAGVLLLVVDERVTGYADRYRGGGSYPVMDADVALHLVREDGSLGPRPLWSRRFAAAKSVFGAGARAQYRKHLAAHPPVPEPVVRETVAGPGRPNLRQEACIWCGAQVRASGGLLVGRGDAARVEHRPGGCQAPRPPETGELCALCRVPVAPGTAHLVQVREGDGRWEVRHLGRCQDHPSLEVWREQQQAARRGQEAQQAAASKREAAAKARREKAAQKRADREALEQATAREVEERVRGHEVVSTEVVGELFDKGLAPGERMRIVERRLTLGDGTTATVWDLETYAAGMGARWGEDGYEDDRGGRFFRLSDARHEYQRHSWSPEPYVPAKPAGPLIADCPGMEVKHCAHCGIQSPEPGGWMIASLGLACGVDCYDALSGSEGAHARRFH